MSRVSKEYWPPEWDVKTLDEICTLQIGRTPRRSNQDYWANGTNTWATIADMDSRSISSSKEQVSDKAIEDNKVVLVPKGSLLMSFKLTIGKLAFAEEDLFTNEAIVALNIKSKFQEEIEPDYLYWVLQAVPLEKESIFAVKGRTLNTEKLKRIEMPIPERDVQRRIVARIEALLAEVREMRELHDEITADTARLMTLVIEERFKELPPSRLSVGRLLAEPLRNGWSPPSNEHSGQTMVLKLGAVLGFEFNPTAIKYTNESTDENAQYWAKSGDIFITRSNTIDLVGHAAVYAGDPPNCIYPDLMIRIRFQEELVDPRFTIYWLRSKEIRDYVTQNAKGASPTMKKINQQHIRQMPFPDVDIVTQQHYVAYFSQIENEISAMEQVQAEDARLIARINQGVLARVFRGEL